MPGLLALRQGEAEIQRQSRVMPWGGDLLVKLLGRAAATGAGAHGVKERLGVKGHSSAVKG